MGTKRYIHPDISDIDIIDSYTDTVNDNVKLQVHFKEIKPKPPGQGKNNQTIIMAPPTSL